MKLFVYLFLCTVNVNNINSRRFVVNTEFVKLSDEFDIDMYILASEKSVMNTKKGEKHPLSHEKFV